MSDTGKVCYRVKWRTRKRVGNRVIETHYFGDGRTEKDVTAESEPRPPEPSTE